MDRRDETTSAGEDREDCEDRLASRVLEGDVTPAEWEVLRDLAARDPGVWERLALVVRSEMALRRDAGVALAAADGIELPVARRDSPGGITARAGWTGWAVAALLAGLWIGFALRNPSRHAVPEVGIAKGVGAGEPARRIGLDPVEVGEVVPGNPGLPPGRGARERRVLQDLPSVVMEARTLEGGEAIEVVYLRRSVERALVDELFEMGSDDRGLPVSRPVRPSSLVDLGSF